MLRSTILIPAYQPNENMVNIVKQLSEIGYSHILIVDDGSDEATHGYLTWAKVQHYVPASNMQKSIFRMTSVSSPQMQMVSICLLISIGLHRL